MQEQHNNELNHEQKDFDINNKNAINELLLGEQEPASKSKKFFLIAAGILLVFFVAVGAMKIFGGKSEEKQPVAINQTPAQRTAPAQQVSDENLTADANASTDQKLNDIVQKLQQEASNQSKSPEIAIPHTQPAQQGAQPAEVVAAHKVEQPAKQEPAHKPKEAPVVVTAPAPTIPVQIKQNAQPVAQEKPKPAQQPQPQAVQPAVQQSVSPKAAMNEATKQHAEQKPVQKQAVAQPKPQPVQPKPVQAKEKPAQPAAASATQSQSGQYYIQVGAFDKSANIAPIQSKAQALGFSSVVKQVQNGDKTLQKLQVGPFATKQEAADAMNKAKEINAGAFVIKSAD